MLNFTNLKIKIKSPKNCDILCYDQGKRFNSGIKRIFSSLKISVLYVRLEEINLYIAFKSIISKALNFRLSFKNHYISHYCYESNPKIIISTSHYDQSFLNLKDNLKKKIQTVLVQRCPYKNSDFKLIKKKVNIDQIYFFNIASLKMVRKYIKSKEFILGSFNNNNQKKNKNFKSMILIISGYKKSFEKLKTEENKEYYLNAIHEKKMIKFILNNFSKKYKIKILLKPDVSKDDYFNYSKIDNKYILENNGNPYKFIDRSRIVVTFNNGTMGHESISRKIKNIQIPRQKLLKLKKFYIYSEQLKKSKIKKFFSYILNMSEKTYFTKMKRFNEDIIYFNEKNILLKRNIMNLISKT